jgi:alpha-L-rhamnosidase
MGATTIWERWDGIKPDSTFQTPGMNSLNHYAYGAIGKWLYSTVAGIDISEKNPGYKNIIFRPQPGGGLTHARAEIKTMYGLASSEWRVEKNRITFKLIVPANTTGKVYLPVEEIKEVVIEGMTITQHNELILMYDQRGVQYLKVGSGTYKFNYNLK